MKPAISRKVDMVCEVFRNNKNLRNLLENIVYLQYNQSEQIYTGALPQLLVEKKSKKYKKNQSIQKIRIKNNKGDFVDIGKQKNDEPHSGMVEFPPDDSSKLIQIGGLSGWDEGRHIIQKFKKGKKSFRDFMGRRIGIDRKSKFKELGKLDLVL